ncbi:hypothetical protein CYMTET_44873, partial [Cymbomonas tetramitiformis]
VVRRLKSPTSGRQYALVHCWPVTGRTHQIRVHMESLGHPLVGDVTYGGPRAKKEIKNELCTRVWLHCEFQKVFDAAGQPLQGACPIPEELQAVVDTLDDLTVDVTSPQSGSLSPNVGSNDNDGVLCDTFTGCSLA